MIPAICKIIAERPLQICFGRRWYLLEHLE